MSPLATNQPTRVHRLADALACDPRTVQRSIQKMKKLGLVKRILRRANVGDNLPNEYDMRGLAMQADKLAADELATRELRKAADRARTTSPKAFNLIKGGKE